MNKSTNNTHAHTNTTTRTTHTSAPSSRRLSRREGRDSTWTPWLSTSPNRHDDRRAAPCLYIPHYSFASCRTSDWPRGCKIYRHQLFLLIRTAHIRTFRLPRHDQTDLIRPSSTINHSIVERLLLTTRCYMWVTCPEVPHAEICRRDRPVLRNYHPMNGTNSLCTVQLLHTELGINLFIWSRHGQL